MKSHRKTRDSSQVSNSHVGSARSSFPPKTPAKQRLYLLLSRSLPPTLSPVPSRHLSLSLCMASITPAKDASKPRSKAPIPVKSPPSDPNPFTLITPDKPIQLPPRTRNRGVALSVKEVRKIAQGLQKSKKRSPRQSLIDRLGNDAIDDVGPAADPIQKPSKGKNDHINLPEKYEMLGEFFDCLESSIRLLRLKGSMSTFGNICPKIESLTDRRFLYRHLAQLKYIFPEAIVAKKILVHDERTLCMKPDLLISLQLDAAANGGGSRSGGGGGGYLALRKMFRARLLEISKTHPEGDEVPEDILPEPFNETKPKLSIASNVIETDGANLPPHSSEILLQRPSHLSHSFKQRFSQKKFPIPESAKTLPAGHGDLVTTATSTSDKETCTPIFQSPLRGSMNPPTSKSSSTSFGSHAELFPSSPCKIQEEHTSMKSEEHGAEKAADNITGTPAKLLSTPLKLISSTPELRTPKRCRLSPRNLSTPPNRFTRCPNASRALEFPTPTKKPELEDEKKDAETSTVDEDILNFLPQALLHSLREKEKKAMEERDKGLPAIRRRQQMIACLPKLFDMIQLIFQSMKRSVITKHELTHKIISNNYEIVDRREVEEQLKLLQELLPDWISGKMSSSGDFLICVNKISSPEEIYARLAEAE
ncbi:hypothetical protein ACLOJK_007911 [Asimina triloba]